MMGCIVVVIKAEEFCVKNLRLKILNKLIIKHAHYRAA